MFGFNIDFEIHEVILEVYIEDKVTQRQQMQGPKEILIANFLQLAKQIKNDKRPMKIKMIVPLVVWDEFEKKQKILNNEVEINNNAMDIYESSKKVDNESTEK